MAGLNKVMLIGNIGKDPEVRSLNSGDRVANFSIATSETWRDKNSGEKKEKTEWHRIVVFNEHLVKIVENYLRKGSKVYVEGQLQTRKYEQSGVEKYATEVVLKFDGKIQMLDSRRDSEGQSGGYGDTGGYGDSSSSYAQASGRGYSEPIRSPKERFSADLDDEIPF